MLKHGLAPMVAESIFPASPYRKEVIYAPTGNPMSRGKASGLILYLGISNLWHFRHSKF
jgi:hypothetical protein